MDNSYGLLLFQLASFARTTPSFLVEIGALRSELPGSAKLTPRTNLNYTALTFVLIAARLFTACLKKKP